MNAAPHDVLDFWLGDGVHVGWPSQDLGKRWFVGGNELDEAIKHRFGARVLQALDGTLRDWTQTAASPALGRLAHTLLLDQFTRNVFRGQARAFSGDSVAQQLVMNGLDSQFDKQLPLVSRVFFYMPLMHAENLELQNACVAHFEQMQKDSPPELKEQLQGNLDFARTHRDIIEKFGRFPYRNAVMGRASTAGEIDFLENGPRFAPVTGLPRYG